MKIGCIGWWESSSVIATTRTSPLDSRLRGNDEVGGVNDWSGPPLPVGWARGPGWGQAPALHFSHSTLDAIRPSRIRVRDMFSCQWRVREDYRVSRDGGPAQGTHEGIWSN